MKILSIFLFLFFYSLGTGYTSADPIYKMIGKSLEELTTTFGSTGLIKAINENDTISIYQTEIGYQSFIIHQHKVVLINSTSHWDTKSKAIKAFEFAISLYKKDGFEVSNKTKTTAIVTNGQYRVNMEISFQDKKYQLSETIKEVSNEDQK